MSKPQPGSSQPVHALNDDTHLTATATCRIIEAAAASDDGKDKKLPTVEIDAYNGGIMAVDWWGDVAIDLSALQAPDSVPILFMHNAWSLDNVLGQTSLVANDGKTVKVNGCIMSDGDTAKKVLALAKNGFKFQASVGVAPVKSRVIRADESVNVNGQTLKGPFKLVEASKLKEISIVPLGADGSTSAKIAAGHTQEGHTMPTDTGQYTPQSQQQPDITAAATALAEKNRVTAINAMAKAYPEIAEKAIKANWTTEQVETEITKAENADLKAKLAQRDEQAARPRVPHIADIKGSFTATPDILAAAVCMNTGLRTAEKSFGAETCSKASDMRIRSMSELLAASFGAEGKTISVSRHDPQEFIKAAASTRSFPVILSNVANKYVLDGYGTIETAWEAVANVRSVVDFKTNTGVRMVFANLLKEIAKDGEFSHGTISEESRTIKADTKGLIIGITRQDIINDDLNVLSDLPRRLGFAAARTFNADFWKVLNGSAGQFNSANGNTMTGALNLANLKKAEELYMKLKDSDGNPLGLMATTLLTGPGNGAAARELFVSTNLIGAPADKSPSANIYAGMFKPVTSAYADPSAWYLVAPPMAAPLMEVAFLNGRREPFVETSDSDFNTLGIQMRCYYDYGCAFAEWRGAVRSSGV